MSEGQKIWFVYLSDHHEGPFTAAEVAEKASQGLVNAKTLVWKDGMPEWVPAETIPEIQTAISGGSALPASAAPADLGAGLSLDSGDSGGQAPTNEEPSLAQMLAQSQQQQEAPSSVAPESSAPLSLDAGQSQPAAAPAALESSMPKEPGEHEQVWTMKSGTSVSGLFTMHALKEMAGIGEIPATAQFWHPGLTDFVPLASFPALQALRREKKRVVSAATKPSTVAASRPGGLAPLVAGADVGGDEETDTEIEAPKPTKGEFWKKITGLFNRKKKEALKVASVKKTGAKRKISVSLLRPILMIVGVLAVGGISAAVYFIFLASPIPDMEDVRPADLEKMRQAVKSDEVGKMVFVRAVGDDVTPTLYVATNLAEGVAITLNLEGVSGTLVNALQFKKQYTATVDPHHIAAFPTISDNSKPLPMGDYSLTLSAPGAQPVKDLVFIGLAKKNHIYERRMAQYKQKLQESYDQELQELKEFLNTEKSLFEELTTKITHNLTVKGGAAQKTALLAEWSAYVSSYNGLSQEIERKLKENASDEKIRDRIYPEELKRLISVVGQITQLVQEEGLRLNTGAPPAPDRGAKIKQELDDLEKWLSEALMKSPIDVLTARAMQPATPPAAAPATPPAAAVPPPSSTEKSPSP